MPSAKLVKYLEDKMTDEKTKSILMEEWVELYKSKNPAAGRWAAGYGASAHSIDAQARVFAMADLLAASGLVGDGVPHFDLLSAADRIASAAMWLVVHETYAQNVYLDGMDLTLENFKPHPEGHTGGSLNMVPAYVGYMAIKALNGFPRSWIMGLGRS